MGISYCFKGAQGKNKVTIINIVVDFVSVDKERVPYSVRYFLHFAAGLAVTCLYGNSLTFMMS